MNEFKRKYYVLRDSESCVYEIVFDLPGSKKNVAVAGLAASEEDALKITFEMQSVYDKRNVIE